MFGVATATQQPSKAAFKAHIAHELCLCFMWVAVIPIAFVGMARAAGIVSIFEWFVSLSVGREDERT